MKQKLQLLGLFAILPLVMVTFSPDLIEDAYAQKAKKNTGYVPPKSYGTATDDIVCGDRLCSTPEGQPDPGNEGRAQ
ncbi:MAG: hypothetical protein ACE5RC_03385 [Nitrosopumilus sp.]